MSVLAQFSDGSGHSFTSLELQQAGDRLTKDLVSAGWREGMSALLICELSLELLPYLLAVQKLNLHVILLEPKSPDLFHLFRDKVHGVLEPGGPIPKPDSLSTDLFRFSGPTFSICTSGTTGTPKLVTLDQQTLAERSQMECEIFGIKENSRHLCCMRLSHELGFNQIFSALQSGASLVLTNPLFPQTIIEKIDQHQIEGVIATPQFWMNLVKRIDPLNKPRHSLKWLSVSGGGMPPEMFKKVRALFPETQIFHTYGKTETGRSLFGICGDELVLNRFPVGVSVELENGELIHTGRGLALQSDGQRETRHASGDLFTRTEKGNYVFGGRRDNQVKYLDSRIHLEEIESFLNNSPGVIQSVCVIENGRTTWDPNQILVAYIEAKDDFSLQKLKEHLHAGLSLYKIPREFRLIKEWPMTRSMKIDRSRL